MEIWKNVIGYNGLYQVSNFGRVRNCRLRILYQTIKKGYYQVKLSLYGIQKYVSVHRLVCMAFIDNVNNYPFVNHIDSNRLNNNICNLEWCTHIMNMEHSKINLRHPRGSNNPNSYISDFDAAFIKKHYKKGINGNCKILSELFCTSKSNVCNIYSGRSWLYL